jgi:hypothetical protein
MAMFVSSQDPSGSLLSCGTHFRQSLSFGPVLLMSLNKWEFTGMIQNVLLRDFNGFYMVF